ncbi:MAG TPA: hypothetical protein VGS79_16020 [Puia sp.]|nr:hypothetical protein [Puia sp.]
MDYLIDRNVDPKVYRSKSIVQVIHFADHSSARAKIAGGLNYYL